MPSNADAVLKNFRVIMVMCKEKWQWEGIDHWEKMNIYSARAAIQPLLTFSFNAMLGGMKRLQLLEFATQQGMKV